MKRLPLKTHDEARRSLSRLIRLRYNEQIDSALYRDLVYGFDKLYKFFRLDVELEIEKDIAEIKELMNENAHH